MIRQACLHARIRLKYLGAWNAGVFYFVVGSMGLAAYPSILAIRNRSEAGIGLSEELGFLWILLVSIVSCRGLRGKPTSGNPMWSHSMGSLPVGRVTRALGEAMPVAFMAAAWQTLAVLVYILLLEQDSLAILAIVSWNAATLAMAFPLWVLKDPLKIRRDLA